MHQFEILQKVLWKQMTREDACAELNTNARGLQVMLSTWQTRLGAMNLMISKLQSPANTKKDQVILKERLAVLMNVTHRQINRVLERAKVTIPAPKTVEKRQNLHEIAKNRREMQYSHALDAIMGNTPVIEAAENAEVSTRQMYRIIDKLCAAVAVDYRDLKDATLETRSKIAQMVAIHQGIE